MIPGAFEYHRPKSLDAVMALLGEHGDEGRLLAGGHSLIPMMKLRLANPAHLIDLRAVAGLRGIEEAEGDPDRRHDHAGGGHRFRAAGGAVPILRETALQIADPQVRYCGTIGGNVANGDPGNDMPAVMPRQFLARGPSGERSIPARDYYRAHSRPRSPRMRC